MSQRSRWPLPSVVNPPDSVCFQVQVPNNRGHIGAFLGAMYELSKPYAWQNDVAHTAKQVGAVWLKIFDNLVRGCPCPQPAPLGQLEDFAMPIRVDCDCNIFVTCCDGTEKQIFTSDQVKAAIAGGNVQGAPQPPAGGGCQGYDLTNFGNAPALIPVPLNAGDTITISDVKGASSKDGLIWRCAEDGLTFFASECVGTPATDPTNRLPASPEGRKIVLLDGSYYDFTGDVFTVPGGTVNKQASIWLNWPSAATIYGSIQAHVDVCNNTPASWVKTFDFTLAPGDFGPWAGNRGLWVAGVGWEPNAFPETQLISPATGTYPAGVFFDEIDFVLSPTGTAEVAFYDGAYHFDDVGVSSPHAYAHPVTAGWVLFFGATTAGTFIKSITIRGHGVNPY